MQKFHNETYLRHLRSWPISLKLRIALSKRFEKEFFFLTFSILGKMACTDGRVQSSQHEVLEELMDKELNFSSRQKISAFRVLRESRRLELSFQELLQKYFKIFEKNRKMLRNLVGVLLDIAQADNRYTEIERAHIKLVLKMFEISRTEYHSIKQAQIIPRKLRLKEKGSQAEQEESFKKERASSRKKHKDITSRQPYTILGVDPKDSTEKIKKSYRALVMRYHPDRLRNSRLSALSVKQANLNFHKIQAAYEAICKERGIR